MPAAGRPVHLLAALDQRCGVALGQAGVEGKATETTRFAPLLEPLDLARRVITAAALPTQREYAEFPATGKGTHDVLVVKKNQPGPYAQVKYLPWRRSPVAARQHNRAMAARSTAPSRPRPSPPGSAFRTPPRPSA